MNYLKYLFLLLIPISMTAQQEKQLLPVDWKAIQKEVKENPEHVKGLVYFFGKYNLFFKSDKIICK